jgi:hypothetical protein
MATLVLGTLGSAIGGAIGGFAGTLGPCMDGSRVTRGSVIFGIWSGAAMYSASELRFARAP